MNSHPQRPENNAGRFPIPLVVGAWMVGGMLAALVFQKALMGFVGAGRTTPPAAVRGAVLSGDQFKPSRKLSSMEMDAVDMIRPQTDPEFALGYVPVPPEQAGLASSAAAAHGHPNGDSALTWQQRQHLGSEIDYQANRLLRMLTDKYNLTPAQQARVFAIIARATPAATQLAATTGESLTDASLAALAVSIKPENWTFESLADPAAAATDATLLAQNDSGDSAPTKSPRRSTASPDPLDEIEPQLASFLDPEQLTIMDEEQIDRYYWWGEILLQISGDIDDDAAIAAAALGFNSGTSATLDETPSADDATDSNSVPAAHQDGNLLDLLD